MASCFVIYTVTMWRLHYVLKRTTNCFVKLFRCRRWNNIRVSRERSRWLIGWGGGGGGAVRSGVGIISVVVWRVTVSMSGISGWSQLQNLRCQRDRFYH